MRIYAKLVVAGASGDAEGVLEKKQIGKKTPSSHERSLALAYSLSQSLKQASANVDTDPFKVSTI